MSSGPVLVVGVGDDGVASLSQAAREAIQRAELLCGGHRHLALFAEHPAEKLSVTAQLDALVDRLQVEAGRRRVVVLASGDPCYYGIGPILTSRLGRDRVEIIPNVGAVALAFARLGENWHDATVVSAHGRPLRAALREAVSARKIAVLTDAINTPGAVAKRFLELGVEDAPAWVFEHLGGPDERQFEGRLSDLSGRSFADLNVLVMLRENEPVVDQVFGRSEAELFHHKGLITKSEVRAVSLSKLRLRPDSTLWDVGAGSGSLAVEAAGLMPRGTVYAVEKSDEQVGILRKNVAALRRQERVEVIAGQAPEALHALPPPDAVFVGGSGGRLSAILDVAYNRLRPAGRITANLATIEHLQECTNWTASGGVGAEVVQVSICRGEDILGMTRLVAQNPVFVVTIERSD